MTARNAGFSGDNASTQLLQVGGGGSTQKGPCITRNAI